MSVSRRTPAPAGSDVRRVREQVRDAAAVMAVSALGSTALAGVVLLVLTLGAGR